MFKAIKVRGDDKHDFDRLLHERSLQQGANISQHELFHRMMQHAVENKERRAPEVENRTRRSWKRFQFDLGHPTHAAAEIDRVVYGLDP
ncbi:MAG: hypothetical protein ACYDDF_06235 [Thermoplasmatota archaeon]